MRIGLLSDTHGHLDDGILAALDGSDEIWHAGDLGSLDITDRLKEIAPVRAVYGNIDDHTCRAEWPEIQEFDTNGLRVLMIHIGGYPGRYPARIRTLIEGASPGLFICGHSHILKVIPDPRYALLHINPGAAGHHGFHLMRTCVRFCIDKGKIDRLEVVELGRRGHI